MNLYRRWGRLYVHFSFGAGRLSVEDAAEEDEFSADDVHPQLPTVHIDYTDLRHPFQDAEALQGNIITPAGAQSGTVRREESPTTYNPVNQRDEE